MVGSDRTKEGLGLIAYRQPSTVNLGRILPHLLTARGQEGFDRG